MLTLAQQQQALLRILRKDTQRVDTNPPETDPWLTEVVHSPGLAMVHEIAAWWLRFQIESHCRLTSRLMKRMGSFDQWLAAHSSENTIPPAVEELTHQFLSSLARHPDPLLRAVAAFEQACLTPSGPPYPFTTLWDRNPNAALTALNQGTELPPPEPGIQYTLTLGPGSPLAIHCSRETTVYA
jgi:hypothetical protein